MKRYWSRRYSTSGEKL